MSRAGARPEQKRVLVADHAASSRDLLRSILEESNYVVAEAADCEQLLESFRAFKPHLVIIDLQLPRLDGCAAVAALRQIPVLRQTPVIAMTAALTLTAPEEIFETGFSTYLVKPIAPARLRRCVASALQGNYIERMF